MWNHVEYGEGRPLVLLHGFGMSHKAWKAVIPLLAPTRRVIAFDTAGFGESPELAAEIEPTIANLTVALRQQLIALGIDEPVDIVGNSMGGWIALEAARLGFARSVVAISPAGLWLTPPKHIMPIFFGLRRTARMLPRVTAWVMKNDVLRELFLAVPISNGARHMPVEDAIAAANDFAHAPGFERTFSSTLRFKDGESIAASVPITIAFGTKDWLLTRNTAQRREVLPKHIQWLTPKDWGHVPMWKDPEGVSALILNHTV